MQVRMLHSNVQPPIIIPGHSVTAQYFSTDIFMKFTLAIIGKNLNLIIQSFVPILTICNFSKVKQFIEGVSDPEQFIATLVQNKSDVLQVKIYPVIRLILSLFESKNAIF